MMNGADLYIYLQDKQLELNKALRLAKDRGIDLAKVLYLNAQEAINVFKLQCRLVEAQLKREWQDG